MEAENQGGSRLASRASPTRLRPLQGGAALVVELRLGDAATVSPGVPVRCTADVVASPASGIHGERAHSQWRVTQPVFQGVNLVENALFESKSAWRCVDARPSVDTQFYPVHLLSDRLRASGELPTSSRDPSGRFFYDFN